MTVVYIVHQNTNPSTDFFIRPLVDVDGMEVHYRTFSELPAPNDLADATIIFVRYVPPAWKTLLKRYPAKQVVFFMDDDLFDGRAHSGLPLGYRWKLYRLARRHKAWLRQVGAELWVSNSWLGAKYQCWQPRVLIPRSPYVGSVAQKTVFYHGSASHKAEIQWLMPVIEEVLQRDPAFSFELIGNTEIRKLFSHLPRIHVLQPMSWLAYKALVSRPGRSIGLAPLLPGAFNQARSATKFFDITQAGAVGIYADHAVYQSIVRHEENGLLLPMEQELWTNAILDLGNNAAQCERMMERARNT